ESS
ncbi:hypothetical protein CP082626L3_0683B, partial [Chlamydia psittaci 08-2626_L3]